jgi:23S rRNA (guanine745-N1)-methyltransferase
LLSDVLDALACPMCAAPFAIAGGTLRCANGHVFDIAREGYVNLLGGGCAGTADTADMVHARRSFLGTGHYRPIADGVVEAVARAIGPDAPGVVVDAGAGTGYYLAAVLDAAAGRAGLALDVSKYAMRAAARAHARIGAAVCDTWRALPVRDGAAAVVLDVFAPRNPAEMHRVLAPGGALIVVTPTGRHLQELVTTLGLISVDAAKEERLDTQLAGLFERTEASVREYTMPLGREEVAGVVAMGPSSRHVNAERLSADLARLPARLDVTASVTIASYRRA